MGIAITGDAWPAAWTHCPELKNKPPPPGARKPSSWLPDLCALFSIGVDFGFSFTGCASLVLG
ncbi:MAG: hypothetical protein JSS86_11210 [Cyanobacteria bacterium SZAS LIN-2]|nr:hypothetical protein [Cyanobacteria bacterium SZAS LIN-2]